MKKLITNDLRFRGVKEAKPSMNQPGVHEIRVVVDGQAPLVVEPGNHPHNSKAIVIPYRREQVIRYFVPSKEEIKDETT